LKSRRFLVNRIYIGLAFAAVVIAVVPLVAILVDVVSKGIASMNLNFFTMLPPPACGAQGSCVEGGMANAIQGTALLVGVASAIGIPIGIVSGVYISEYAGHQKYGSAVRFLGDVLASIPSIVTGVLFYILIVVPSHGYSVTAGSIALATMMIPIVSNTSTEALKTVPNSIREASHALGVRKWRTSLLMVAQAKRSIATASLLAVARIAGETAPLVLTTGISQLWFSGFNHPVASLPFYIYFFATNYPPNWKTLAWGAAFILIVFVLGINMAVRIITRSKTP
jgi:phosphate transport system permease protein